MPPILAQVSGREDPRGGYPMPSWDGSLVSLVGSPFCNLYVQTPRPVLGLSLDVCTDPEPHGTLSETTLDLSLCGGGL